MQVVESRRVLRRASIGLRLVAVALLVVYAAVLSAVRTTPQTVADPSNAVVFFPVVALAAAFTTQSAYATRVRADGDGLHVVNVFSTWRIGGGAVVGVRAAGLSYLYVDLAGDRAVRCWAVQATNLMLMLNRRTRVDQVAEDLRPWVEAHRGVDADEVQRTLTRPHWTTWTVLAVVLATAVDWYVRGYLPAT